MLLCHACMRITQPGVEEREEHILIAMGTSSGDGQTEVPITEMWTPGSHADAADLSLPQSISDAPMVVGDKGSTVVKPIHKCGYRLHFSEADGTGSFCTM